MRRMKKKIITRVILYGALCMFLLYAYRFRILEFINDNFYKEYKLEELDTEQKLEDFESFYSNIVESVPFLDEHTELYGIDFEERYEYYKSEILKTQNNFQYYCTLKAIGEDIPSFHTDICFPLYSNLQNLNCYNSKQTLLSLGKQAKIEAWTQIIEDGIKEYENVDIVDVKYVSGKYMVDDAYLAEDYQYLSGYEVVQVDGSSVDEYVTKNISIFNLYYDYANNKPYRKYYVFNNREGNKVSVLWKNQSGNQIELDMYVDYGAEVAFNYGDIFADEELNDTTDSSAIVTFTDDINEVEYVEINNFDNSEGEKLKKYLKNTKYDTVIIDLRNNYGGYIEYAQEYIYSALYSEDVVQSYEWLIPGSTSNQVVTDNWLTKIKYEFDKDENAHYYHRSIKYEGKVKNNKDVYYLVGPNTGSAADTYISMIKENNLGTIVGSCTGGEGLGDSFICNSLDNSSLIYVYFPSVGYNENTGEELYSGTRPDVYVDRTAEEYSLWRSMLDEGDANTYENRLLHDAVLKWVIENAGNK